MGLVSSLLRRNGGKFGILMFVVKLAVELLGRRTRRSHYDSPYNRRYDHPYGQSFRRKSRKFKMKHVLKHAAADLIARRGARW